MTIKEKENLAHYFMTYLHYAFNGTDEDSADVANLATDMVKNILAENEGIRYIIWQYNQQEFLDRLGLDYGKE